MQTFAGLKFGRSQRLCGLLIVVSGIFWGILGVCVAESEGGHRPNVVVILADDLGYGDLSAYGGWIRTPNIDQLAKSGMRMTDFHSNGAVCSPTRGAFLTGKYPQRNGIDGVVVADSRNFAHLDGLQESEWTIGEHFQSHGYATAVFGKWHVGYYRKYNPLRHGFDEFKGYVSGNVDFFSHIDQSGQFDWWHGEDHVEEEGYVTHLITEHSVDFIKRHAGGEKPFFLYVAHEAPHYPYQGPHDKPERSEGGKHANQGARKDRKVAYREMVEAMDVGIGQIVQTLKDLGELENTVIFFFSDNGATALGSNGNFRGNKGSVWEGGHRVPAMVSWPGVIEPGQLSDRLMAGFDLFPTLSTLCGLPRPEGIDGEDYSSVFLGKETGLPTEPRTLFWEHNRGKAVRHGSLKWVSTGNGAEAEDPGMLFDLSDDPSESTSLAIEDRERLAEMWVAWKKSCEAGKTPQPSDEATTRKPRILIIGDSISLGYMDALEELAGDRWDIHHNPGNARYARYGLNHIHDWIGDDRWDVIHFNWGLWDLCYRHPDSKSQGKRDKINGVLTTTLDDYRVQLERLAKILRRSRARLVWANTTPVPDGEAGRFAGDEIKYNRVATGVMREFGIQINDLHGFISPRFDSLTRAPGDVHFNDEGSRLLAEKVVVAIESSLNDKP